MRLLAELDPTGVRRKMKTHGRRRRPTYSVAGPRSLYHADGHEKLAHVWGLWFHGCIDGYSRYVIYLVAADNKFAETVRVIYVHGCEREGWPSRTRWDKGSENVLAIREQVNRHFEPSRPETGARGSAITGRSMDNARMEGFWRYCREQVTDQFLSLFDDMRHRMRVVNPYDPHDLFCLHTIFLPVLQHALDSMRAMWNEHPIRKRARQEGHVSGIPALIFKDAPLRSATLLAMDDDAFYATRGTLQPTAGAGDVSGADEDGSFGVERRAVREEPECVRRNAHVLDPLALNGALQQVRDAFFAAHPLAPSDSAQGFGAYVERYLLYKQVCAELLQAQESYFDASVQAIDWHRFGVSCSAQPLAQQLQLRAHLAQLARDQY